MHLRLLYDDDRLSGGKGEAIDIVLSSSYVEFGEASDLAPDRIVLQGAQISGKQFTLSQRGDQFFVQRFGLADMRLNDSEMRPFVDHILAAYDTLWLPGLRIDMIPEQKPTMPATSTRSLEAWQQLQRTIFVRLQDEFQLDQQDHRLGEFTPEVQRGVERRLDAMITSVMRSAEPDVLVKLVGVAVRRWITRILAEGTGEMERAPPRLGGGTIGPDASGALDLTVERFARAFVLELDPNPNPDPDDEEAVYIRLAAIEARFDEVDDRIGKLFAPAVQREIAASVIFRNIYELIFSLGPLSELMELESVTEIMVMRFDQIYVERAGRLQPYPYTFASEQDLLNVIERMIKNLPGRRFDNTTAMIDFRYSDGSRVNAVRDPLTARGATMTIRKFPRKRRPTLHDLTIEDRARRRYRSLVPQMADFLDAVVNARLNIVISGGTGSGKTTLLNALGRCISVAQRVVTIEDTAELDLGDGTHVVYLQTRPASIEEKNAVAIRDLVRNALRMRPDRIVVGECRGGEALDMLQAMNTGHSGSMTTAHANSAQDMMLRMETMVLMAGEGLPTSAIRQQIVAAIDVLVQLNKLPNGRRMITEISEVVGISPISGEIIVEPIYVYRTDPQAAEGRHYFTGYLPTFLEGLLAELPGEGAAKLQLFNLEAPHV